MSDPLLWILYYIMLLLWQTPKLSLWLVKPLGGGLCLSHSPVHMSLSLAWFMPAPSVFLHVPFQSATFSPEKISTKILSFPWCHLFSPCLPQHAKCLLKYQISSERCFAWIFRSSLILQIQVWWWLLIVNLTWSGIMEELHLWVCLRGQTECQDDRGTL